MSTRRRKPRLEQIVNQPLAIAPSFLEAWLAGLQDTGDRTRLRGEDVKIEAREVVAAASFTPGPGRWGVFAGYWKVGAVGLVDMFGPLGFHRFDWDPWGEMPNQTYADIMLALGG